MTMNTNLSRRRFARMAGAAALVPGAAMASPFREITWDDLIPPGVAYGQIVGPGLMDEANDTWIPQFDANATRMNMQLDGVAVKLPGYIIPLESTAAGTTGFILVPYVGACIHVPPPPPNQLVYVTTRSPWPSDNLWDAIWVSGRLSAQPLSTQIADIGYRIVAQRIETYAW